MPSPRTKTKVASATNASPLRGQTLRWTFKDGPTKGTTYEHTFNPDGSVEFGAVSDGKVAKKVRVGECATARVGPRVVAVSYLSEGGYTLTVVLDLEEHTCVGFASNEAEWSQQTGTFEVVHAGARTARAGTSRPSSRST